MPDRLRWGFLGTGNIARQFAAGLTQSRRSVLTAVGSRSVESARGLAGQFGAQSAHGSYEALLQDPDVDAVYLSLPNSMHHEWAIKALVAGKHVLCEKPFALDAAQSQQMFDVAQRCGKVIVEAFMYRCHPQTKLIVDHIAAGHIGQVRLIRTNFCYCTRRIDGNVRFDRTLGGGALMDVGCYCINLARFIAGSEPRQIHAVARMHERGVDELTGGVLGFDGGICATFSCGMTTQADNTLHICGTDGYIECAWPWKPQPGRAGFVIGRSVPPKQDLQSGTPAAPPRREVPCDCNTDLFAIEADAFAAVVLDGAVPWITRNDTLGNMAALDEIRRQIGLSFQ